jgi:hypothetical protein
MGLPRVRGEDLIRVVRRGGPL